MTDTKTKPMTIREACAKADELWGSLRDTSGMRGGPVWSNHGGIAFRTVTQECWSGRSARRVECRVGIMSSTPVTCISFSQRGAGRTFEEAFEAAYQAELARAKGSR